MCAFSTENAFSSQQSSFILVLHDQPGFWNASSFCAKLMSTRQCAALDETPRVHRHFLLENRNSSKSESCGFNERLFPVCHLLFSLTLFNRKSLMQYLESYIFHGQDQARPALASLLKSEGKESELPHQVTSQWCLAANVRAHGTRE